MKICTQLRTELQKALEERDKIIEKVTKTNKWVVAAKPKPLYYGLKSLNLEPFPYSPKIRNATPNRASLNDRCVELTEYIEVLIS